MDDFVMSADDRAFTEKLGSFRFRGNPERSHLRRAAAARATDSGSEVCRSVGILGGGTAGYLAALGLQARLPGIEVTLIESSKIPIIGVGEATVDSILPFLHKVLGIDVHEFYREVKPTWKLGIKFEWGLPPPYHFQAPFDWGA